MRTEYSITAMPTWVRAVRRMPTTAIVAMITMTTVQSRMFGQALVALAPKTAKTAGDSTTTTEIVPVRQPASIIQPTMKPR